jgi:copper chaperone NosL
MTIVDKQHASQIVTIKGRSFKYDAIECMMNDLAKWEGRPETHLLLVADYDQPGTLVDATKASYLISEAIPSPMGEFLTGFQNGGSRDDTATAKGGNSLSWEELREEFLME